MPPEMWELLKSYGTAAPLVGFCMWWGFSERGERKEAQAQLVQTLRDVTATVREATGTSQLTTQLITELTKRAAT